MLVVMSAAALVIFSVIVVPAAFMTVCMPMTSATLVILCVIVSVSTAALLPLVMMLMAAAAAVRALRLTGKNFVRRRFAVLDDLYIKFQLLARKRVVEVDSDVLLADSLDAHAGSRAVLRLTEKLHTNDKVDARKLLFRQDLHGVLLILADPVARAYANRFALARL